ncbi:MAG TPA: TetR/AcrR family transcriptional regulator [Candidatus Binataceae bacterium]
MNKERDLHRTRSRLIAAAASEFAAKGLAGARTCAIARRAGVDERMIFYCFKSKEGLYREVLRQTLTTKADLVESDPGDNFTDALINGFGSARANVSGLRMWQWEALGGGRRKLAAEQERRKLIQAEVARLHRAKARGELPADVDQEMLLLVSFALRIFPLALPQLTWLVTGLDPLDPEFRRRWIRCLQSVGGRIEGEDSNQSASLARTETRSRAQVVEG